MSTFLFEVPTGVVADVYSRRLSIIIGYLLIGANNTAIPIRVGSLGMVLTGIMLALIMPETGFHPTPQAV